MENRLRECPWCRYTYDIEVHVHDGGPEWEEIWEGVVTCGTCGRSLLTGNYWKAGFTPYEVAERAIESWNTRVIDPLLENMAKALEEVRRCMYKNKYSSYTLTDDFDPSIAIKVLQEYREMRDATTSN